MTAPARPALKPDVMPADWSLADFRGTYAHGWRWGQRATPDGRNVMGPAIWRPCTDREHRGCQEALAARGLELRPQARRTYPWSLGTWVVRTIGSPRVAGPPR